MADQAKEQEYKVEVSKTKIQQIRQALTNLSDEDIVRLAVVAYRDHLIAQHKKESA